jgi:hypothetical protein
VKSSQILYPTGHGDVEILFALNRWVLVRLPRSESLQRQVASDEQLAALLHELGLTETEAQAAAREAWRQRPASAALKDAGSHESLRSAASIPTWLLVLILGAFCVLALYALTRWATP